MPIEDRLAVATDRELQRLLDGAEEKRLFLEDEYREIADENVTNPHSSKRVMAKMEEIRIQLDHIGAYIRMIEAEQRRRHHLRPLLSARKRRW